MDHVEFFCRVLGRKRKAHAFTSWAIWYRTRHIHRLVLDHFPAVPIGSVHLVGEGVSTAAATTLRNSACGSSCSPLVHIVFETNLGTANDMGRSKCNGQELSGIQDKTLAALNCFANCD